MSSPARPYSLGALVLLWLACGSATAQNKGEPGRFDFYLLNLAWAPEFCSVPGASAGCTLPPALARGFVLHGLWPQKYDGSYPVFCSEEPGPKDLATHLDITPDLGLLRHEWDKHGTCAAVGPARFFRMERDAFNALKLPARFQASAGKQSEFAYRLAPNAILGEFYAVNPTYPRGSLLLSCSRGHLTAVEACLSKELKPIRCVGLQSCGARLVVVDTHGDK